MGSSVKTKKNVQCSELINLGDMWKVKDPLLSFWRALQKAMLCFALRVCCNLESEQSKETSSRCGAVSTMFEQFFRLFKHTILIPSFSNEFKRCMSPWILSVDTYYDILGWETRTMAFRTKSPKWTEERRRLFACKNETRTKLPKLTFKKNSNVPDDFNWQSWSHFEWIQLSKSNPLGWIQVFKRNRMFNPANF